MPNEELMNKIRKCREAREQKIKEVEEQGFEMRDGRYQHPDGRTMRPYWLKKDSIENEPE